MKKKFLLLITVYLLLITSLTGCKKKTEETVQPETQAPTLINQLPVQDRPYITLVPREDGKEVTLTISDSAGADLVEYELEYQAGNMIQGAFGRIDFTQEPAPVSKNLLFGSCSKGKCKYDENVSGGSLTLRFEGDNRFALKGDFNLEEMTAVAGEFNSKDGRVVLDVGAKGLSASTYMVVINTLGLPAAVEGEVVAGPYGFFTASPPAKLSAASLSWQTAEDPTGLKIYGYVDNAWEEYTEDYIIKDKTISVTVDQLTTFVLVKN